MVDVRTRGNASIYWVSRFFRVTSRKSLIQKEAWPLTRRPPHKRFFTRKSCLARFTGHARCLDSAFASPTPGSKVGESGSMTFCTQSFALLRENVASMSSPFFAPAGRDNSHVNEYLWATPMERATPVFSQKIEPVCRWNTHKEGGQTGT